MISYIISRFSHSRCYLLQWIQEKPSLVFWYLNKVPHRPSFPWRTVFGQISIWETITKQQNAGISVFDVFISKAILLLYQGRVAYFPFMAVVNLFENKVQKFKESKKTTRGLTRRWRVGGGCKWLVVPQGGDSLRLYQHDVFLMFSYSLEGQRRITQEFEKTIAHWDFNCKPKEDDSKLAHGLTPGDESMTWAGVGGFLSTARHSHELKHWLVPTQYWSGPSLSWETSKTSGRAGRSVRWITAKPVPGSTGESSFLSSEFTFTKEPAGYGLPPV